MTEMRTSLDVNKSVKKYLTLRRVFVIAVLGCAAVSLYWSFPMMSGVTTVPPCECNPTVHDYDTRHVTPLLQSVDSTTTLKHGLYELSGIGSSHQSSPSHSAPASTTTTAANHLHLKSTAIQPFNLLGDSSSFQTAASVDGECMLPLFCSAKYVRNCVTNDIIGQVPESARSLRIKPPKARSIETSDMRRQSFKKVFETRAWGHDWDIQHKGLNASGMGATLYWTQEAAAALHLVINQLKLLLSIKRVRLLDVPCGDMAWMSRFLRTRNDIDYTGVDIVPELIHHHQKKFAGFGWHFYEWDVVRDGLNFSDTAFDLILCRAMLQHLYSADVLRTLAHISSAPFIYNQRVFLLTSSASRHPENEELQITGDNPGRFRRLNLELPPVSLVPPLCMVRDGPPDVYEGSDLYLGLWELPLHRVIRCRHSVTFTLANSGQILHSCVDWSLKHR